MSFELTYGCTNGYDQPFNLTCGYPKVPVDAKMHSVLLSLPLCLACMQYGRISLKTMTFRSKSRNDGRGGIFKVKLLTELPRSLVQKDVGDGGNPYEHFDALCLLKNTPRTEISNQKSEHC